MTSNTSEIPNTWREWIGRTVRPKQSLTFQISHAPDGVCETWHPKDTAKVDIPVGCQRADLDRHESTGLQLVPVRWSGHWRLVPTALLEVVG